MTLWKLLLTLATVLCVAYAQSPPPIPASVTSIATKYKDDACFASVVQPNATVLASTLCPPAACAPKIDEVITTYVNSGDNYYALYGHVLSFNRDMACHVMKPSNTVCVEQIGSTLRLGDPAAHKLAFFNDWSKPAPSYLRTFTNVMTDLRRTADKSACDPSTCANKYLVQWHAWAKSLPDEFLNNMPPGNLLDKVDLKGSAATLEQDVVAMCKDTQFAVGGLAAQLEVDTKLPRKPAPKTSGAKMGVGMGRVVVLTWAAVLGLVYYTSLVVY